MIEIRKLPADRWKDYRDLRLEALKKEPMAFGSSPEEESELAEETWRKRIMDVLFAMDDDEPVGMVAYVFEKSVKFKHIAGIYGFYVRAGYRGQGVGSRLLEEALRRIRMNKAIIKVKLAVISEQREAIGVYEKAGFVVTGRSEKELKVGKRFYTMLFMEKVLRWTRESRQLTPACSSPWS